MPKRTPVPRRPGVYSYPTRRGTRYVAVAMHDGKQTWLSGFTTARLADEWREAEVVSMRQGRAGKAPARMTLAGFIDKRWWPDVRSELKPQSVSAYTSHRNHIEAALGSRHLKQLDERDVQDFKNWLADQGVGASMRSATYKRLRQILNHAVRLRYIHLNPCDGIAAPAEPEHKAPIFSPERVELLLQMANEGEYGALFTVVVFTGLRWGELAAMEWEHIDWTAERLDFGKDGKTRTSKKPIRLGPHTLETLRNHHYAQMAWAREQGCAPPPTVFVDSKGERLNYWAWTRAVWYPLRQRLGLPSMHFHDLRHVHATLLAKAKVHPSVAQRQMRHGDVRTTLQVYTDVDDGSQLAAVSAVEALVLGGAQP